MKTVSYDQKDSEFIYDYITGNPCIKENFLPKDIIL